MIGVKKSVGGVTRDIDRTASLSTVSVPTKKESAGTNLLIVALAIKLPPG
jgi:hypothetical protein